MKVFCHTNILSEIPDDVMQNQLLNYFGSLDSETGLEIGKEYTVHGIVFWDNCPFYYIYDDINDLYPTPSAFCFFDIVDSRLSSYWKITSYFGSNGEFSTLLAFTEWADDHHLYERLINNKPDAIKLFSKYRSLVENEY